MRSGKSGMAELQGRIVSQYSQQLNSQVVLLALRVSHLKLSRSLPSGAAARTFCCTRSRRTSSIRRKISLRRDSMLELSSSAERLSKLSSVDPSCEDNAHIIRICHWLISILLYISESLKRKIVRARARGGAAVRPPTQIIRHDPPPPLLHRANAPPMARCKAPVVPLSARAPPQALPVALQHTTHGNSKSKRSRNDQRSARACAALYALQCSITLDGCAHF